MALVKQQFFFPFSVLVHGRYFLLGPVWQLWLIDALQRTELPDQNYSVGLGRSRRDLLQGAPRAQGYLLSSCGRWKGLSPKSQSITGTEHGIPPAAELSSSRLLVKHYWQYNGGAGPLNYHSHPPAKKNILPRKERVRCCFTRDGTSEGLKQAASALERAVF